MLDLDMLQEQCGVGVITGFDPEYDYTEMKYKDTGVSLEELKEKIYDARREHNHGMVLATYNSPQLKHDPKLPEKFKEAGLKCLVTFTNPNSDNQVWIYYKMLVRPRRKPAVAEARRAERPRFGRML